MNKKVLLILSIISFAFAPLVAKSIHKKHVQIQRTLELYYFPECPYCQKVIKFMQHSKVNVQLKNIRENSEALETLIKIGGKKQVPCLFIDGKPLYESNDIINWLKKEGLGK